MRGDFRIEYRTDFPERISGRSHYLLRDPRTNETVQVTLDRVVLQDRSFIASFSEFATREQAGAHRGWLLEIAEDSVPCDTEEGEFYYFQLEGLSVLSAGGRVLGRVVNVIPGAAHELLEYEDESGALQLVAFARSAISEVNLKERRIILQPEDRS
ncbi:16S rRNA processing protein RimM [bacterium]|nr:16S rRNA processing protein RimM [bacterium]